MLEEEAVHELVTGHSRVRTRNRVEEEEEAVVGVEATRAAAAVVAPTREAARAAVREAAVREAADQKQRNRKTIRSSGPEL